MLILGFEIVTSPSLQNNQNLPDINKLLNTVMNRVLHSCKDRELPRIMFSKILKICAESMNRLQYSFHMDCFKLGLYGGSNADISGEFD
jgi:hypothetical protein